MPRFFRTRTFIMCVAAVVLLAGAGLFIARTTRAGLEWEIQKAPESYQNNATMFNSIAFTKNADNGKYYGWVAGDTLSGTPDKNTLLYFNGAYWQELSGGNMDANVQDLTDVAQIWYKGQYQVWAVGKERTIWYLPDGISVCGKEVGCPEAPGASGDFTAVAAVAVPGEDFDQYSVFVGLETNIYRGISSEVRPAPDHGMTFPGHFSTDGTVMDIAALDSSHIWAVTNSGKIYFNGDATRDDTWDEQGDLDVPSTVVFTSISAASASNVWAAGVDIQPDPDQGVVYYYNGTNWAQQTVNNSENITFNSISAAYNLALDEYNAFVVGTLDEDETSGTGNGALFQFNGSVWEHQDSNDSGKILRGVSAASLTQVRAVGEDSTIIISSPGNIFGWVWLGTSTTSGSEDSMGWASGSCANDQERDTCNLAGFTYGVNIRKNGPWAGTLSGNIWIGDADQNAVISGDCPVGGGTCASNPGKTCATNDDCTCRAGNAAVCVSTGWISFNKYRSDNPEVPEAGIPPVWPPPSQSDPLWEDFDDQGVPYIARYDSRSGKITGWGRILSLQGAWSALGQGVNGNIYSLAVFNNELIAGGSFTQAGGQFANNIAKWNGSSWSPLGDGLNSTVFSLAVYGSDLIAGGVFSQAGGQPASHIAKWNGSSWSPLGAGFSGNVNSLTIYGSDPSLLIAGGGFIGSGSQSVSRIASWDGSSWSPLGSGMDNEVWALSTYGDDLIAGGVFTQAGGVTAYRIASWDGSSWSLLGSGMNNAVKDLSVYGSDLIAGGYFTQAGSQPASHIAKWDGSSWSPLGSGTSDNAYSLTVYGSDLIVGGSFTQAGGVMTNRIAKWDGSDWSGYEVGFDQVVNVLEVYNYKIIAGGQNTIVQSLDNSGWIKLRGNPITPVPSPVRDCKNCGTFCSETLAKCDPLDGSAACNNGADGTCDQNICKLCEQLDDGNGTSVSCNVCSDSSGTCGQRCSGDHTRPCTSDSQCSGFGTCSADFFCSTCESCDGYGVSINDATGRVLGYGWSGDENGNAELGWIDFSWANYYSQAWLQTQYGDIYAQANIGSAYTPSILKCNATYVISAAGTISNFCTSATDQDPDKPDYAGPPRPYIQQSYDQLFFPSQASNFTNILGRIDIDGTETKISGTDKNKYGDIVQDIGSPETVSTLSDLGFCSADGAQLNGKVYHVLGDLTISPCAGWSDDDEWKIKNGGGSPGSGTLIVDGSLTIDVDMAYDSSVPLSEITKLGSLGVIVKRKMLVTGNVGHMVGSYLVLDTAIDPPPTDANKTASITIKDALDEKPFTASGLMIAPSFKFGRTYRGTLLSPEPAEQVTYDGRVIANPPPGFRDFAKVLPLIREAVPSS